MTPDAVQRRTDQRPRHGELFGGVASRPSPTAGLVRICGKHGGSDTVQVTRPVRQLGHDSHRNLYHRPDPVRQSLWCHLREKDGRIVRYCFMATSRITEPGVERC